MIRALTARFPGIPAAAATVLSRRLAASGGLKVLRSALAFAAAFLAARWLGAAEYGRYAIAMSVISLLAMLGALGLPQVLMRQVAVYEHGQNWALRTGLMRRATQYAGLLAVLMASLAGAVTLGGVVPWVPAGDGLLYFVAACMTVPVVLLRLLGSWLIGREHLVMGDASDGALRYLAFLGLLGIVAWLGIPATGLNALLVHATALCGALALTAGYAARGERDLPHPRPHFETGRWLASALPMMGTAALYVILRNTDILMLGALAESASAGVYHIATRMAELAVLPLTALNAVIAPMVARLWAARDRTRLRELTVNGARLVMVLSFAVFLVFLLAGRPILTLVGDGFEAGWLALVVLVAANLVPVLCGSAAMLLNMAGFERDAMRAVALGTVANVSLNALLIPPFGLEGAAVATGGSLVLWNVLLVRAVVRRLGIDPTILSRRQG